MHGKIKLIFLIFTLAFFTQCSGTGSKIKPVISNNNSGTTNLYFSRQGGFVASGVLAKIEVKQCADRSSFARKEDYTAINEASTYKDAARNKINKWTKVIEEDQVVKCRSNKDFKSIKIFQMCAWDDYTNQHGHTISCDLKNKLVYDESMLIGRIQINLNDGKKRKFLYFQTDYKVKQSDGG